VRFTVGAVLSVDVNFHNLWYSLKRFREAWDLFTVLVGATILRRVLYTFDAVAALAGGELLNRDLSVLAALQLEKEVRDRIVVIAQRKAIADAVSEAGVAGNVGLAGALTAAVAVDHPLRQGTVIAAGVVIDIIAVVALLARVNMSVPAGWNIRSRSALCSCLATALNFGRGSDVAAEVRVA